MARRRDEFQTIRSEGGLLPSDLLRRVLDPKEKLEGTAPQDYGLPPGERLIEVITQSWNRLRKHWAEYRGAAKNLPEGEAGTGLTNDKWSVPLLRELNFGMLPASTAPQIDGQTYAINRFFGATAIHLVGCGLSLDRRTAGARGAATANPHGLVQDFLNRSQGHLWGILSNGLRFRILRYTQAISRQSYLEFDLEAMFDGEVFSDFVVMWLTAHATRFAAREDGHPESCWLERWTKIAEEQGTRALGDLRGGVEQALQILGQGFVGHPKNTALRDALRKGQLTAANLHGQLLRIVYRLIFLFVAEDRTLDGIPLLHPSDTSDSARLARERYATHYSAGRLRKLAGEIRGSRHGDLWWQFNLIVGALSVDERFSNVRDQLALPILGSILWSPDATAELNAPGLAGTGGTELANSDFLEAIKNLAFTRQYRNLRPVDYRNLGAEELGGVYESLLALTPQVSGDGAKFTFAEFAVNERKTSGSYYTPDSLVQSLLDSALDPVLQEAIKDKRGADAEEAILALKVCDPAVGSGHFLVGAGHRLAGHLARIRAAAQGEGEPSPGFYQHALRDVIGRCLYGVDINPMAAELCRVSLWLEALDPGRPLTFLDHHIRVGNSLLGTTSELIAGGLPDDAFNATEGDDKKVCAQLRKRNKAERQGFSQGDLLGGANEGFAAEVASIAEEARKLDITPDDSVDAVRRKADQFSRLVVSTEYKHAQLVADAWCAAFVWVKTVATLTDGLTTGAIQRLASAPSTLSAAQAAEIERLSSQYQFFHWHLAFPEVFAKDGFDCLLGNPPWDALQFHEEEFFAHRRPEIATAPTAAKRKRMIGLLREEDCTLFHDYERAVRLSAGSNLLVRGSGKYPLTGLGRVNLFALFAESARSLISANGRIGQVLPSGIVTDDSTKLFVQKVVDRSELAEFFDFENRDKIFPGVHAQMRFGLMTLVGRARPTPNARFVSFATRIDQVHEPTRRYELTAADIALLNPQTRTCPIFRSRDDAALIKAIYRRVPVLLAGGWRLELRRLLNVADDSDQFVTEPGPELLPLYEAKYFHQYDHRWATSDGGEERELTLTEHQSPDVRINPRYWYPAADIRTRFGSNWHHPWALAWRDITNTTNERTYIATIVPSLAIPHTAKVMFMAEPEVQDVTFLAGNGSAMVFDYVCRQKMGGTHMSGFIVEQLPWLSAGSYRAIAKWSGTLNPADWLFSRVLELTYTAWDLEHFAEDIGFRGPPFRWDEERRLLLRAELDAAFFHLYLLADANGDWVKAESESEEDIKSLKESFAKPRYAVDYIMETFPIVKKRDIEEYGDYRTKLQIVEIYDEMQQAIRTATEYTTKLDPPPGDKRCCHPPRATASA